MTVSLDARRKGTHMSRFITVIEELREPLTDAVMRRLLEEMLEQLQAESGTIEVSFPFFIRKSAP
ncbi:Converts GTP to 7,8-dihydroneopterin triphosphate, partial [Friedmanniomyces endolithicus]